MARLLTVKDLGLPEYKREPTETWTAAQFVEPTRDGQFWCDWDCAEDMLVRAARAIMRGVEGVRPEGYKIVRDDEASTLTLNLALPAEVGAD